MYKSIFTLLGCLMAALSVQAQVTPLEEQRLGEATFSYGLKGGIGVSMPDVDEWRDAPVTNIGVHDRGGLRLELIGMRHLNNSWALRSGLHYAAQGYTERVTTNGVINDRAVKHNYIQIPLLLQLAVTKYSALYTGFKGGYMAGKTEGFRRGDVSWEIGGSWITVWRWGFDAAYSVGLANIAPEDHPVFARAKNRSLQVGLFFLFTAER